MLGCLPFVQIERDDLFVKLKANLAAAARELFPPGEGGPKLTAVKQGNVGDCWFMSMMGITMNFMSTMAMGLVAGVLVDDAIVEI